MLNDNVRQLLKAIADGDSKKVRAYAKVICKNEAAARNQSFCNTIIRKIEASEQNLLELPHNVKPFLLMEDVSASFKPDRYYMTKREIELSERILDLERASKILAEVGVSYLNAAMLYGESGTGKTLFGRYIASRLGLPLVYINLTSLVSSYLGSTSKNIGEAFKFASEFPCVFMLDEIDAIGVCRSGAEETGAEKEMSRVTIALMQAMDRMKSNTVLLAATNRLDLIDKAVLRRFTINHKFKKFTALETEKMIRKYLDDVRKVGTIEVEVDEESLRSYCSKTPTQSSAIAALVHGLAKSVLTEDPIVFAETGGGNE